MTLDLHDFLEIRLKAEELYKNLTEVYCPYFREKILFNAQGLEHLKFKGQREARSQQDQYMRLKLLRLAPLVLNASGTLQGIHETKTFEKVRSHNRTDTMMKNVEYYEFIAVLEQVRVKVIVKRIEGGQRFFWSIIPYWGIEKHSRKRRLHNGFPEED